MTTAWPDAVERVSAYLREAGAEARIEEFTEGTPTAADAAAAVGCTLEQIVKSLVLLCDGRPVVALVPGDKRADPAKIARAAGAQKARIASAEEVVSVTGFGPGAVAPFPLPKVESVFVDRALMRHQRVWAGAGSDQHIVGLAPAELARLSRASVVDVAQDQPYHSSDSAATRRDPKER